MVASNSPDVKVGDHVQSMNGWREWYVADATHVQKFEPSVPLQGWSALVSYGSHLSREGLRVASLSAGRVMSRRSLRNIKTNRPGWARAKAM